MVMISYRTKQNLKLQREAIKAIAFIGCRQASYSEIARDIRCSTSEIRYAVLDLIDKGYITRIQLSGVSTKGARYAYELTKEGKEWMQASTAIIQEEENLHIPGTVSQ